MIFNVIHPAWAQLKRVCATWAVSDVQAGEQARVLMLALHDMGLLTGEVRGGYVYDPERSGEEEQG